MGLASRLLIGQRKLSAWEPMGRERPKPSVAPHPGWCSPGPHTPSNSPCGLFSPCLPTETAFSRQTDSSSNTPAGARLSVSKPPSYRKSCTRSAHRLMKPEPSPSSPARISAAQARTVPSPASFAFSFAITKSTCLPAPRRRVSRHTERPSLPTHLPAVRSWAS